MTLLIGLTGGRGVGKSTLADPLVLKHGFARMHPFDGGKAAVEAYLVHIGVDPSSARAMVSGSMKDTPCPQLPLRENGDMESCRYLMEKFGAFMGVSLGSDWTLGAEVNRLLDQGVDRILSESVVFEADEFRRLGGILIEVVRPGRPSVEGVETDPVVAALEPDHVFLNNFASASEAQEGFVDFLATLGLVTENAELIEDHLAI